MTWLDGPVLALDTEATSANPLEARVLSICLGFSSGPGRWNPLTGYLRPNGFGIPAESIAIHGLTAEKLAELAGDTDRSEWLRRAQQALSECATDGVPIVGHGLRFDLTLLAAEFARHDVPPLPSNLLVLDTLILFRRLDWSTGGRTLSKLAARHGITFPAHDAEADALASLRLLHIIAGENELLPHVALPVLHRMQAHWYDAQQEQARAKALGNGTPFTPAPGWPLARAA